MMTGGWGVAESAQVKTSIPGGHTKNLFLKDKKDALFLITALEAGGGLDGLHHLVAHLLRRLPLRQIGRHELEDARRLAKAARADHIGQVRRVGDAEG